MGITFNGTHSDTFDICVKTESMPYIGRKRSATVSVLGRDGGYVFDDAYENIIIPLQFSYYTESLTKRRKIAREIASWLSTTGILIFDYELDMEYEVVKQPNDISANFNWFTDDFIINFECKPYQKRIFDDATYAWEDVPIAWEDANFSWEGEPKSFDVTSGDTISITNKGTYKALPTIKLTGIGDSCVIGPMTYSNLNGDVYIDCDGMVVYSLNGEVKENKILNFEGDFIKLEPGENEFVIGGTFDNLVVEFIYQNTYQ